MKHERRVIKRWFEGQTAEEIARSLGLPEHEVRVLIAVVSLVAPDLRPGTPVSRATVGELTARLRRHLERLEERGLRERVRGLEVARPVLADLLRRHPTVPFSELKRLLSGAQGQLSDDDLALYLAAQHGYRELPGWSPVERQRFVADLPRISDDLRSQRAQGQEWEPRTGAFRTLTGPITLPPGAIGRDGPAAEPKAAAKRAEVTERAFAAGAVPDGKRQQFLVQLRSSTLVPIHTTPFLIGRSPENHFCLREDDSVSRSHVRISEKQGSHFVEDLNSRNGTLLNERRLEPHAPTLLCPGDTLLVGHEVLRFDVGVREQVEFEAVSWSQRYDPLTKTLRYRRFFERLDSEVARASHHSRPLSFLSVAVDDLKGINDAHGDMAGDRALVAVAQRLNTILSEDDLLAIKGATFVMALPEKSADRAAQVAATLLEAMRQPVAIESGAIPISVSVGLATLGGECTDSAALEAGATAALSRARGLGGNRVSQAVPRRDGVYSSLLETERLVYRTLSAEPSRCLVALDPSPQGDSGPTVDQVDQLLSVVEGMVGGDDYVGVWRRGTIIIAPTTVDRAAIRDLERSIQEAWGKLGNDRLRTALVLPQEVDRLGLRVFEVLAERLTPSASPVADDSLRGLPYPVASPIAHIGTAENLDRRFHASRFAVERTLNFVAAVQQSLLRSPQYREQWPALGTIIRQFESRSGMAMGSWTELVVALGKLLSKGPVSVTTEPFARFGERVGSAASSLAQRIESLARIRNRHAHGRPRETGELVGNVEEMLGVIDDIKKALRPLRQCRLVSQHGIRQQRRDGTTEYLIREHDGPSDLFGVVHERFHHRLYEERWCYLLGVVEEPLLLAPWVMAATCDKCNRYEVFVATRPQILVPDDEVVLHAVNTEHQLTAVVPEDPDIEAFGAAAP